MITSWEQQLHKVATRGTVDPKRKGTTEGATDSSKRSRDEAFVPLLSATVGAHCEGCGRVGHARETCRASSHPDWNKSGLWAHSAAYKALKAALKARGKPEEHPTLPKFRRADGTTQGMPPAKDKPTSTARSTESIYGPRADPPPRPVRFNERGSRGGKRGEHLTAQSLSHITCDCDDTDVDAIYRICCITVDGSPSYKTRTLFDTGANPTSFVNRKVAAWINALRDTSSGRKGLKRHWESEPTSSVALAGTALTSPIYGSVVFDLTFFNEVTRTNETIRRISAKIIDSCIDLIISRPVIRENHLVHKIPHYFDETNRSKPYLSQSVRPVTPSTKASCVGAQPCVTCTPFVAQGYDNTLCSLTVPRFDRPRVPHERRRMPHADPFANQPPIEGANLIDKSEVLDPLADDDDIDWKENPFEIRPERAGPESPDELLAMIQFAGPPEFQEKLRSLCREFIDVFSTSVRSLSAKVEPMVIDIDRAKWEAPRNRLPPRNHSAEKQLAIRTQIDALLRLGVIEESRASEWSQVHLVPKPTPGEWRFTLDFVQLNAATGGLEGWPIPNIQQTLSRLGTLKPTVFGLIDFTAGYHQTPLAAPSRALTAFRTAGGLYQWTRVAMGLKGAGPYFQRSMANKVLVGLVYRICEIYIDDVLIHAPDPEAFLANLRPVLLQLSVSRGKPNLNRSGDLQQIIDVPMGFGY